MQKKQTGQPSSLVKPCEGSNRSFDAAPGKQHQMQNDEATSRQPSNGPSPLEIGHRPISSTGEYRDHGYSATTGEQQEAVADTRNADALYGTQTSSSLSLKQNNCILVRPS